MAGQGGVIMERAAEKEKIPAMFLLKCLLFSYIVTVVLLAVLAFLLYKLGLGEKFVSVAIIAIYVLATVLGGMIAGKRMQNRRFLWGLLVGAAYFVILAVVSVIFDQGSIQVGRSFFTTLVLCAGGGMLGGMMS